MTLKIETIEDLLALRESEEVEAKLAAGRDGSGEIPRDFWETYSAFANTRGGYVVLGAREEKDGRFLLPDSVINVEKLKTDLFNQLNNLQKVSTNLIRLEDVERVDLDHRSLLVIRVPQASRQHKPVFINGNPLTGSYRRLHDGDRLCDAEAVKRLLAEQTDDSRDSRILRGFGVEDLHAESIDLFRRLMSAAKPSHPFLEKDRPDFLRAIGALKKDRETGQEGLTVAGLLMLGTSESIRDEFPNYAVDYQERDEKTASRWVDRITTDGTWSGNLLDFYRLVWRRLTESLKAPFQLIDGQRQDETPIHTALREALVNCLVHADYTGRSSVLVVKRPDMFGFRNPGLMRVPIESAIKGGESDGRNRTLQQMFLLIGAGERAGSGVPKIHQGWRDQHWRPPALYEKTQPSEQTLLELRMEDLLPAETVEGLRATFGVPFEALQPEERVILVTAALETTVSHSRVMSLCDLHATDLTRMLQNLVQQGFLVKNGAGRGTKYHLPGVNLPDPETAFSSVALPGIDDGAFARKPLELGSKPSDLDVRPPDLANDNSEGLAPNARLGRFIEGLKHPIIHNLQEIEPALQAALEEIASELAGAGKVPVERMRGVILNLCSGRYMTLKVLAELLNRDETYLRQSHLSPMAEQGVLARAFPQRPNDPRQAYLATSSDPIP
ncbi:MAG: RNA-binding domain-containing protein [Brevundimonas aurantiaca]|uniref:RNA-binding domain-containing protein n=1 Tax=Brevundimonas aurantiaca TaxID=74316 RepID=UPI003383DFA7